LEFLPDWFGFSYHAGGKAVEDYAFAYSVIPFSSQTQSAIRVRLHFHRGMSRRRLAL
jgi:hypothetical protein